jgi:cell division protein FtsQ
MRVWPAHLVPRRVLRRVGAARLVVALLALVALGGGWLWFRGSSLVAVEHVKVTGLTGPSSGRIRAALAAAARTMSTLDLRVSRLYTAVSPYPAVKSLAVSTDFPHGLRIHVVEEVPVAVVSAAGRRVVVSADGKVLRGFPAKRTLPMISVPALPEGSHLTERQDRQQLSVLAGAPPELRARVSAVLYTSAHGVVVTLRDGPRLYFGSANAVPDKWLAATAVLGSSTSGGAAYIDLTDPSRPAAG